VLFEGVLTSIPSGSVRLNTREIEFFHALIWSNNTMYGYTASVPALTGEYAFYDLSKWSVAGHWRWAGHSL